MNIAGNRALVTGAGKRLGREMALYLARRGFDVAVHYRHSQSDAQQVVDNIKGLGRDAVALCADFEDDAATQALIPNACEVLGGSLTVLVNSASHFEYDRFNQSTREIWDRNMQSNLRAPFLLTQEFAEQVPDALIDDASGEHRAQGLIVNILDQKIRKLTPHYTTYTLAKWGLWGLTQTSAQGLAPAVRVNAIGPGTTLQAEGQPDYQFINHRMLSPLKRGAGPTEINATLGFFLDCPSVTGQLICVDGGQHLGWMTPEIAANPPRD